MAVRVCSRLQASSWKRLLPPALARGMGRGLALAAALGGCGERGRLLFEPNRDGIGPDTTIDRPETADAVVPVGPDFSVTGRVTDSDGVDSVYFEVLNGNQQFQPFVPSTLVETVRFSIPISTTGRAGDTLLVMVFGTDRLGTRGDTSVRRLFVR